ncbi:MAG: S8 family serine peptidase [Fibrobacterota bacterium]
MKKNAGVFAVLWLCVWASITIGAQISVSSLMRGGTPPAALDNSGSLSSSQKRALLVHGSDLNRDRSLPAGVFGTYDESQAPSSEDVIWYHFDVSAGNARFIHLEPTGDEPVRVTLGWENESEEFHARATTAGRAVLPWTVAEEEYPVRGNNTTLLAERLDIRPDERSGELDIQIRKEYGTSSYSPARTAERSAGFLIISGARVSDRMARQESFQSALVRQDKARADRVEAYLEKHNVPRKEELPDGGVRELVDVQDGEPVYARTLNLGAAQTSHADKVWPGGDMGLTVSGSNIPALGEWDEGPALSSHREFDGRVTEKGGGSNSNHGTHVAGTMVAGGVDDRAKGMCYEALHSSYNWNSVLSQMATEAGDNGMLVSQHSYTMGQSTSYDDLARQWDDLHLNYPYKLGSKSAGNDGQWRYVRDAGNAKNNITIGAINEISGGWTNPGDVSIASFSSRGPSDQNRVKPDIVAKGVQLYSSTVDGGYDYMSGTSMAGPAAAGMLGLMQDYYYQTHNESYMRAATLKAVAINTAGDAGTEGPDATFGWGVIHVARAARLMGNNAEDGGGLIQELTLNGDETMEFDFSGTGEEEIKATIVWPDSSGSSLNNDLDMRIAVDGQNYEPWYLTGTDAASRGDNSQDNVEKINTGITAEGADVRVKISHKGSLSGGSQDFSFAISGVSAGTRYSLDLTHDNGSVLTDPDQGGFPEGTEVELTAVADYGYEFSHWSGDISGSDNPQTIVMDSDKNVTAHFEELTTYALDISSENGTVYPTPDQDRFVEGEEVSLHACPETGYIFSEWGGDLSGSNASATIVMDSDKTVTALFKEHGYVALDQSNLSIESVSSEDEWGDGRPAENVLDGDINTVWFTHWEDAAEEHPHEIVLAMDTSAVIGGLQYTPRQDSENGRIDEYEVYVSQDGTDWGEPIVSCNWDNTGEMQEAVFAAQEDVGFIRLVALSEVNGEVWASVANLDVLHDPGVSVIGRGKARPDIALRGQMLNITRNEPLTLRISSVNGRRVRAMNIPGPQRVDLTDLGLSAGVYILQIEGVSGTLLTRSVRIR